jgi:hypothetical protein
MTTKISIEDRIEAFTLMASLVEMVGPSDNADAEQVRIYELAEKLADSLRIEAEIERDTRELVARSAKNDPTWRDDMATLRKMARQRVRESYGMAAGA